MKSSRQAAAAAPTRRRPRRRPRPGDARLLARRHRELQLDDELAVTDTLDVGLRRMRSGRAPASVARHRRPAGPDHRDRGDGGRRPGAELVALAASMTWRSTATCWRPAPRITWSSRRSATRSPRSSTNGRRAPRRPMAGSARFWCLSAAAAGSVRRLPRSPAPGSWPKIRRAHQALLDLDLDFGTVALELDTEPGSGLCEALEQPSRDRQPGYRTGDGQGDREFAGPGIGGVGGAASDRRRRCDRHAAL